MSSTNPQKNNPLHGVKLADILSTLIEHYGFEKIGDYFDIRAFKFNPTYKSALKFLRTTPWAREKIEELYVEHLKRVQKPANSSDK